MSEMKQMLPFRVVLKWWVGLVLTWSCPNWGHIYTLNQLRYPKISPKYTQTPLQTPSHKNRHLQIPKDTARHLQKFKTSLRQSSNTPQTPLKNSERLSGDPKIIGLSGRCPMVVKSVVGLSGAVFRDVLRCIKVLVCAQGGIWRISPFGVEPG